MPTPEVSGRPEPAAPLVLRSPEQFKALGHPLRHRLVNLLRQRPATLRQLGDALGVAKGTVAHHLGVLQDAGLVHVTGTRQVRGGTEQYLGLVHHAFAFEDGTLGAEFLYRSALAETLPERPEGPENTGLRHLWLTAAEARELLARLDRAAPEPAAPRPAGPAAGGPAAAGEAEAYGLLISLYRADIPLLPADPLLPPDEKA